LGRQPWVRFLRFTAGKPPIELRPFANGTVTYSKVGLAKWPEPSPDTYVLMVSAGPPTSEAPQGNIELRVGSPTTDDWSKPVMLPSKFNDVWKNGEEESRPLVYMGNSVFAAFVLKPGDGNYGFAYQVFSLDKNPTYREADQVPYKVVPYLGVKFVEVSHPAEDYVRPSFRWAGAVTYKGGVLTLCASPRALNDAYSGNYYCWSAKAG